MAEHKTIADIGMATAEKSSAVGNAAKLREALKLCLRGMCGYCRMDAEARGMTTKCVNGCEALRMAKAALAAPARNCDVGTADDWLARFSVVCERCSGSDCDHRLFKDEEVCDCFARWAQMPYEEGGAK